MTKWFVFFLFVLAYFFYGNGWYEPSRLVISGQTTDNTSLLQVRWNSGEGFNNYEQREFRPTRQNLDDDGKYILIVGSKGDGHSASLNKDVVCTAIVVDGKELNLASLANNISLVNDALHFSSAETLTIAVQANSHIGLEFETNNHSGIAFVSVNGRGVEHDLYIANVEAKYKQFDYWLLQSDGSFRVEMDMPRYEIQELQILNGDADLPVQLFAAEIHGKGKRISLLNESTVSLGMVSFSDGLNTLRSFFHPLQFFLQVLFALLTTWIVASLVKIYRNIGSVQACFLKEQRVVFWLFFGAALAVFGLWLLAFWPGVMSVDSLKVWRAAMLPDVYLNDHPVLNVILYKYFFQIWNNPAVIPVVQVVLIALLISWFFFWLYRKGVSLKLLVFCFLFILFSVPIGTYNTVLWKDIPFSLLVVFWACTLVKLFWQRGHRQFYLSKQHILVLLLLGVALGLIRHNGLVYLLVLPLLFVLLRLVSIKQTIMISLILCCTGMIAFTTLQQLDKVPDTGFIEQEIKKYASDASMKNLLKNSGRIAEDYVAVLNINQTMQSWDKFHYFLKDRYAYWFLLHSGWWDVYPFKEKVAPFPWLEQKAMKIYKMSYQEPWVWFSWNPLYLLLLLPVVTVLFWWFPYSATFGVVLLAGSLPLIYLRIFNWRYYYFLYLGLLFILPLLSLDLSCRKIKQVST